MSLPAPTNTPFSPASSCPACGLTVSDLQRTGRLGCACCYEMFHPIIAPQLHRFHHGTHHVGKTPRHHSFAYRKEELRAALAHAVSTEDFEQAALLRDQLTALASL